MILLGNTGRFRERGRRDGDSCRSRKGNSGGKSTRQTRLRMREQTENIIHFQYRFRNLDESSIVVIPGDIFETTREFRAKDGEGRDRRETTDKCIDAKFDTKKKSSGLELQNPNSPTGNIIRDTTGDADRVLKGTQKVSTISDVACPVILSQGLING